MSAEQPQDSRPRPALPTGIVTGIVAGRAARVLVLRRQERRVEAVARARRLRLLLS